MNNTITVNSKLQLLWEYMYSLAHKMFQWKFHLRTMLFVALFWRDNGSICHHMLFKFKWLDFIGLISNFLGCKKPWMGIIEKISEFSLIFSVIGEACLHEGLVDILFWNFPLQGSCYFYVDGLHSKLCLSISTVECRS